ncbi:MAG: hypothetical protein AAF823_05340 [Planctomycetota bacterium]
MTTVADHPNAVRVLMRLVGVGLLGLLMWMTWLSVIATSDWIRSDPSLWLIPLAFSIVAALTLLGVTAFTMVRSPTRMHLVIVITICLFMAQIAVTTALSEAIAAVFQPAFHGAAAWVVGWLTFVPLLFIAVTAEWKLSKAAGFVAPAQAWWQPRNIQGLSTLSAWLIFFAVVSILPTLEGDVAWLIKPDYQRGAGSIAFLTLIAYCIIHAKALPIVLMRLTGVSPADFPSVKGCSDSKPSVIPGLVATYDFDGPSVVRTPAVEQRSDRTPSTEG